MSPNVSYTLFPEWSTPLMADGCLRVGVPLRLGPPGMRPLLAGQHAAGRVLPARHYGSVDIFLEAFGNCVLGDVFVVDNAGRLDEACVGDLTVLEAAAAGAAGMIVWGAHRDSAELREIGLPVFSCGTCPAGPRRLDAPEADALVTVRCGEVIAGREDLVCADDDGVLFIPLARAAEVAQAAEAIYLRERDQALAVRAGRTLREQLRFADYLARRAADPAYKFRRHLRALGGAIEE